MSKKKRVRDLEKAITPEAEIKITVQLLEAGETPPEGPGRIIHVTPESVLERMA